MLKMEIKMGRATLESTNVKPQQAMSMDGLEQFLIPQQSDNSRVVVLHGEVNEHMISNVIVQLLQLANQNHKPIYLVISTYGGSVDEMFSLYDTIKFIPCPVYTIGLGKVMSAGVLLLASGTKGKRMIGRSARIMIHPISAGTLGNVFEISAESKEYERMQNLMVETLMRETKMNKTEIMKIMKSGHDNYLTAEQAIKMGIIDQIIGDTR
jgi:ATP-dependent Clp protease protease subunit